MTNKQQPEAPSVEEAKAQLYAAQQRYVEAWERNDPDDIGGAAEEMLFARDALIRAVERRRQRWQVDGSTSDGYHTFDELYAYRRAYNAALFNEWAAQGKYGVHKSWKHSDGEPCFGGGWFIVVAQLPTGMISNHYKAEHWDLFRCEVRELSDEYDGHTPQIALQRLLDFVEAESPLTSGADASAEIERLKQEAENHKHHRMQNLKDALAWKARAERAESENARLQDILFRHGIELVPVAPPQEMK